MSAPTYVILVHAHTKIKFHTYKFVHNILLCLNFSRSIVKLKLSLKFDLPVKKKTTTTTATYIYNPKQLPLALQLGD